MVGKANDHMFLMYKDGIAALEAAIRSAFASNTTPIEALLPLCMNFPRVVLFALTKRSRA